MIDGSFVRQGWDSPEWKDFSNEYLGTECLICGFTKTLLLHHPRTLPGFKDQLYENLYNAFKNERVDYGDISSEEWKEEYHDFIEENRDRFVKALRNHREDWYYDPVNVVTICRACHSQIHARDDLIYQGEWIHD